MTTTNIWKTLKLGTDSPTSLIKRMQKENMYVSDWAKELAANIPKRKKIETIDLTIMTLKTLGLDNGGTLMEIFAKAEELGLEPCPPETGLYLRLSYQDQPKYDWTYLAMQPISDWVDAHPALRHASSSLSSEPKNSALGNLDLDSTIKMVKEAGYQISKIL